MSDEAALGPELNVLAERLGSRLGNPRAAAFASRLVLERAPDEQLALAFLLKLAEQSPMPLARALADRSCASDLVFCLGASEVVATGICAMESRWLDFFKMARGQDPGSLRAAMRCEVGAADDRKEAARRLKEFKARTFLQIAIGDLLGRFGVTETMELMSRLADQCIRGALAAARRLHDPRASFAGEFCVVAMGKLGAYELNLSSDIDLMYLYESRDHGRDQEEAARFGEVLTELLSPGCFRVDLRLRPGGINAPLVVSFGGALGFYQGFGETWERAALLRARPVAGAVELGRSLIAELGRFIYRRYLDFDTLNQLRAMKRRVEEELRSPEKVARNIKLGYGGIRELEFVVQALTLIYGGRDPRLRVEKTLTALERLESFGYLSPERARQLAAAYLFLRDVEHKLQVVAGLQTHSLPAGEGGMRALAARMGFGKGRDAAARLEAVLRQHRGLIATQFRETLAGGEEMAERLVSEPAEAAWRSAFEPEAAAPMLKELGFARPAESAGHLLLLARGPEHALASPKRRELLDRLGPGLLDEIHGLPDPDLALRNLAAFIAAVGARTSFLALLEEHPATRSVLLRLFASSEYLSSLFVRHPDMLDTLVRSDLARLRRSAVELNQEVAGLIAASPDFESRLDAIRSFRHQEFLRIAIADLAGDLELDDVQDELTLLAETVVRAALNLARAEVAAHTEVPEGLALCAVAMGRLGAGEMAYNSDLDLIFVYDGSADTAGAGHVAASRIAQKLIAILEARTREGYAYKLDLRLRPSGRAGPLVTSLEGFREYHRESSAVWERQALVRARVIAGDAALGEQVEQARLEFVFGKGLGAAEVDEIGAMRTRMERELGAENRHRLNVKQGPGGLVDVEFLTQMMALRYGGRYPELRGRRTVALIRALAVCRLMPQVQSEELEFDYRFLSRLENRLRIETDQPAWAVPTSPTDLAPLARRMGYRSEGGAQRLLEELEQHRSRIRQIFGQCFATERGREPAPARTESN
jgi:[glutamine synthetase] adenylyltransferase / [glutamine synthetase]-adenylyl-L-tyrosine phosphorylase